MPRPPVSLFYGDLPGTRLAAILRRLPPVSGDPVRVVKILGLSDRRGPVHGGAFLRERRIALDCTQAEFPRVFVHEMFHFVWVRAGNPVRRSFEALLLAEWRERARGELGWSAEWRKNDLSAADRERRTKLWREYCCESFCDTAAWLYSGKKGHAEFTLAERFRRRRRDWFRKIFSPRGLSL